MISIGNFYGFRVLFWRRKRKNERELIVESEVKVWGTFFVLSSHSQTVTVYNSVNGHTSSPQKKKKNERVQDACINFRESMLSFVLWAD